MAAGVVIAAWLLLGRGARPLEAAKVDTWFASMRNLPGGVTLHPAVPFEPAELAGWEDKSCIGEIRRALGKSSSLRGNSLRFEAPSENSNRGFEAYTVGVLPDGLPAVDDA
jgi:hypothetical protein